MQCWFSHSPFLTPPLHFSKNIWALTRFSWWVLLSELADRSFLTELLCRAAPAQPAPVSQASSCREAPEVCSTSLSSPSLIASAPFCWCPLLSLSKAGWTSQSQHQPDSSGFIVKSFIYSCVQTKGKLEWTFLKCVFLIYIKVLYKKAQILF